jgi:phospholipid/cholesterol/gamma-HCH transport system substrate-binding protein
MAVSSNVPVPADTNAKVVSESLLGGMVVVLDPGGDKTMIKAGGEITQTQDAISFTELLAKFMFSGTTGQK